MLVADRWLGRSVWASLVLLLGGGWLGGGWAAVGATGLVGAVLGRWALARSAGGAQVRRARTLRREWIRALRDTGRHRARHERATTAGERESALREAGDAYERAGAARRALGELGVAPPGSADQHLRLSWTLSRLVP